MGLTRSEQGFLYIFYVKVQMIKLKSLCIPNFLNIYEVCIFFFAVISVCLMRVLLCNRRCKLTECFSELLGRFNILQ